jgi:hypothetical protein
MMTGTPPPRLYEYNWQVSRMYDKEFSESICEIISKMLQPHPADRMTGIKLVNWIDDKWAGWRATTKEGAYLVDVLDKVAERSAFGKGGSLVLP